MMKMRWGLVVAAGLCVATSGRAGDGFVGRVLDPGGKGIEGAQVCVSPLNVAPGGKASAVCGTSSADGTVTLSPVPPGAQQVSVRAPRHASIEGARVDWAGVVAAPFTWVLNPAGSLTARLADASGRGVAGAKVTLKDRIRGTTIQSTTDSEGTLRADGLASGYWKVEIEPSEFRSLLRDNVAIEPGVMTDLGSLRARDASFVEGRVVDATGAGVAGAEVRIQESSGSKAALRTTVSDGNGRFRIGGLPPSALVDVLVRPTKSNTPRSFVRLTLPVAARSFAVEPSVTLSGRAVVEDGTLPKGARVVAWLRAGHPAFDANGGTALTADVDVATGHFTVEGVAPGGEVELRLYAPGLGEATTTVAVEAGKDASGIELRPKPTGFVLRGRVEDRGGRPIAGARLGAALSDGEGRFAIEGLQPGINRVVVQHQQYAPFLQEFPADGAGETRIVLDEGGSVEGTVADSRGRPIVGARIAAGAPGLFVTSGVAGRYRIDHVPSGESGVERQSGGNGDVERRKITINLGEVRTVDFRFPGGILEGAVTRAGEPVSGASISVRQSSDSQEKSRGPAELVQASTASDEEGSYRVVGLRPGVSAVVVTDGKQSVTLPMAIADEGASRLNVEMPLYALEGVVLDGSGAPIAGACVASGLAPERRAKGRDDDPFTRTFTDGQGKFVLYTDESDPQEVTVCTCAQGCHDVGVDAGARGTATLWFAPVGTKPEIEPGAPKR